MGTNKLWGSIFWSNPSLRAIQLDCPNVSHFDYVTIAREAVASLISKKGKWHQNHRIISNARTKYSIYIFVYLRRKSNQWHLNHSEKMTSKLHPFPHFRLFHTSVCQASIPRFSNINATFPWCLGTRAIPPCSHASVPSTPPLLVGACIRCLASETSPWVEPGMSISSGRG